VRRPSTTLRTTGGGFSLVEVLVVIAIVGLMLGAAVYGFRAIARSDLRSSASKLGAAIRYCFDRSITTGQYYRIVLDLDRNSYWAERSDERMYLARDKENAPGKGQAFDRDKYEKELDEADKKEREAWGTANGQNAQIAATLEPPPKPRRAHFATFKDASLPTVQLKKTRFFDVYTPRQREPYTSGRAYLYFFPDGHTERAFIRLQDGDAWYSLIVHALTGRVEVLTGKLDIPRDFDQGATR
jgi:general secretion pathway protein H